MNDSLSALYKTVIERKENKAKVLIPAICLKKGLIKS